MLKLPKLLKGSKRLDKTLPPHAKGTFVHAAKAADGSHRFTRLNAEGTVSAWKIVPTTTQDTP